MKRILLVGEDTQAIAAPAAILATTGASILCCTPSELTNLEHPKFDLVVLTPTLKPGQQRVLAEDLRLRCPQARVLHVLSGSSVLPSRRFRSTIAAKAKSGVLIEKVIRLLAASQVGTLHILRRPQCNA